MIYYGENTNIFAYPTSPGPRFIISFSKNPYFLLKMIGKIVKISSFASGQIDNKTLVVWHQLMIRIKWWVFVIIKMSWIHMYNAFECHFKANQKSQSYMSDPVYGKVWGGWSFCVKVFTSLIVSPSPLRKSGANLLAKIDADR